MDDAAFFVGFNFVGFVRCFLSVVVVFVQVFCEQHSGTTRIKKTWVCFAVICCCCVFLFIP